MGAHSQSVAGVVEEITRIHRSLPPRPAIDEVEAAAALVRNVDKEEQSRIDAIARQRKGPEVPDELFFVLQEMQKGAVRFHSGEQKREALKLLDLEAAHNMFDELIQRASSCIPSISKGSAPPPPTTIDASSVSITNSKKIYEPSTSVSASNFSDERVSRSFDHVTRDDSYVKKAKPSLYANSIAIPSLKSTTNGEAASGGNEKISLIKLASLIEVSSKKGTAELNLRNMLADQVDWLPDSIGKLSRLVTLDLSENRIVALPATIGSLSSLTRLDLHSNLIAELPDSIGNLFSLLYLDLRGNQLTALPPTIGKLVHLMELDLGSNRLALLPDTIGNLTSLKKLNLETNDLEELPYTIGGCTSLVELRADYNRLRALPEAVGKLDSLEVINVRYNNIKSLPTTMASLSKLKEIDASFNELESIPESLCLATSLVKMNVGNNFADLRSLPHSFGNLEMLEELDISNNQIRFLPDSFAMLSRLRILHAEENPLEVPPRHVAEKGAQAAVEYMVELITKREVASQPAKAKTSWAQCCFFSRPNKRKHDGVVVI